MNNHQRANKSIFIKTFPTAAAHANYMGALGEITFDREECQLRVHDGCCCGGKALIPAAFDATDLIARLDALEAETDNSIVSGTATEDELTLTDADGNNIVIAIVHPPVPDEQGDYIDGTVAPVVDVAAGTMTFTTVNDETEAVGTPIVADLSGLIAALTSSPHPSFAGSGVTYDAGTDTYTFTDTDTDTFASLAGTVITFANGDTLDTAQFVDDDVTGLTAVFAGNDVVLTVTEGTTVHSASIPLETVLPCVATETEKLTTPKWTNDFVKRGINFDSADLVGITNPCMKTVQSSAASSAIGVRSSVISSNAVAANGVDSAIVSSRGPALATTAPFTFMGACRGTINADITAQYSGAIGSLNPFVGNGNNPLYNFIASSADGRTDGNYSSVISSVDVTANGIRAAIISSSMSEVQTSSSMVLASNGVINPTPNTVALGSVAGAPSTANRMIEINGATGDITVTGAFIGGFVFPGFGEKAVSDEAIPEGSAVVFDGMYKVRLAKEGEKPDGITTKELALCAGGGYAENNIPWALDDFGNRVKTVEKVEEFEQLFDDEGYDKAFNEAVAKFLDTSSKEAPNADTLGAAYAHAKKTVNAAKFRSKGDATVTDVETYKRNPDYNPELEVITACVEMLGRNFMIADKEAKVGDYVGANGKIVEPALGFRVLQAPDANGRAGVLVK